MTAAGIPPSAREAALRYAACGLSVLPLLPKSKHPLGGWTTWQVQIAEPSTIERWYRERPEAGVGIISGSVSGNLVILDIDHEGMAQWLLTSPTGQELRGRTWVNQTGSGKLHIFMRSVEPCYSGVLNSTQMLGKLADIRGLGNGHAHGGYVVAPPSIHPNGEPYVTIGGSPETIAPVKDARRLSELIRGKFEAYWRESTLGGSDHTILPPLSDDAQAQLQRRIGESHLSPKIKRAIIAGAVPGEGEWASVRRDNTGSGVDYAVCAALIEHGFGPTDVEEIYACFPIGSNCYRNTTRPNHGKSYLTGLLDAIYTRQHEAEEARLEAVGKNFKINSISRIPYDDPIYHIRLSRPDGGQEKDAFLTLRELGSERLFCLRLADALGDYPELDPAARGRGFERFLKSIIRMAVTEDIPDTATSTGHLRAAILRLLRQDGSLAPRPAASSKDFYIGWVDREELTIHLRSGELIRALSTVLKPNPSPERVWSALRAFGGGSYTKHWEEERRTEELWRLPIRTLL